MTLFGARLEIKTLPFWLLALTILFIFPIREGYPLLYSSRTIKILTLTLCWGLILSFYLTQPRNLLNLNIPRLPTYLILAFCLLSLLTTLNSSHPWGQFPRWIEITSYLLLGIILWHSAQTVQDMKKLILISFLAMNGWIILRYLYSWSYLADPINHDWVHNILYASNIRHIGYISSLCLPLALPFLLSTSPRIKVAALVYMTVGWAFVFWMGGRGTFLSLILATGLAIYIQPRVWLPAVFTIATGAALSLLFVTNNPSLNLVRIFELSPTTETMDEMSSGRLTIYLNSLARLSVSDGSLFFGSGADAFRFLTPSATQVDKFAHPHSIVVQILLSYGLAGSLIATLTMLLLLRNWLRQISMKPAATDTAFILASTSVLSAAMIDGPLYHSVSLLFAVIVISLSLKTFAPGNRSVQIQGLQRAEYKEKSAHQYGWGFLTFSTFCAIVSLWVISTFTNQVFAARHNKPTMNEYETILSIPFYIEPRQWIRQSSDPGAKQRIARETVDLSESPCALTQYLHDPMAIKKYCYVSEYKDPEHLPAEQK